MAIVLGDGTIEGFVGGACAEHSVRAYSLKALQSGETLLLRILPFGDEAKSGPEGTEVASEDGAVTVENPCLSGGAIEIFLEPVLPAPRVLVVGDTPIAGALVRLGAELGLDAVAADGDALDPRPGDLALVGELPRPPGHGRGHHCGGSGRPCMAAQTRAGVQGMSMWSTPCVSCSASITASTIAGGEPTFGDSPTPFAPSGWWGQGVTVSPSSKSGHSSAVGIR